MSKVIFRKSVYEYKSLKQHFYGIMDSLGGDKITKGSRVVIKPNLLAPATPESAMLTHPMVVKACVEYVLEKGGRPRVSDSPAIGPFAKVLEVSGIKAALHGLDVEFREFTESDTVEIDGPFRKIEIARDALDADIMINLPKLKTHTQMLLTLGVKNLYGCIVGLRKPEWHLRAGVDREMFAGLLVRIYAAVRPDFTILDGILAMEGQGPGKSGKPRELGLLIGSDNAVALDISVCRMLGLDPGRLLTNRLAQDMGLADDEICTEGEVPRITDFKLPEMTSVIFGPESLHGFMRKHLVQRPVVKDPVCRACGECVRYCPAKAVTLKGKKIRFDYEKCIRCYCCIEVCPYAALNAEETKTGKILRKVLKSRLKTTES
jgi:uncharacterized protein (DUF362 family)